MERWWNGLALFFFIDLLIRTQKPNSVTWSETHLFEHWSPFSRTTPDPVNRSRLASVPPPPPIDAQMRQKERDLMILTMKQ